MTDNELAAYVTLFITSGVTISIVAASWFRYLGRKRQAEALSRGAPRESDDRLARIEQAVDAMAIEVERISEGQRFVTKLLADRPLAERAPETARLPASQQRLG